MGSLFGGKKPPPAPDPALQNQRTQAGIQQNIDQQQQANRPNTINWAGGALRWSQDANGNWTVSQDPSQASQSYLGGMEALGNKYGGAVDQFLGSRPDLGGGAALDQATQFATQEAQRQYAIQRQQLDTQLKNQGLVPGSEAYDNAMRNLDIARQSNIASTAAATQNQFFNQGLANRGQQAGEFSLYNPALGLSGTALTAGSPTFNSIGVQYSDPAQAYNTAYQQQLEAWKQQQAMNSDMLGGIGKLALGIGMAPMTGGTSLIGSGLSGLGSMFSGWGNSYGASG